MAGPARGAVGVGAAAASCLVACGLALVYMDEVLRPEFELRMGNPGYPCTAIAPAPLSAWLVFLVVAGILGALAGASLRLTSRVVRASSHVVGSTVPAALTGFAVAACVVLADYTRYWMPYDASGPHGELSHCPATHGEWRWGQGGLIAIVVVSALAALIVAWRASRVPIAEAARAAGRVVVALGVSAAAALVAFYAGLLVFVAIVFARGGSRWWAVFVYDDGETDTADSRRRLLDMYGHPPLDAWGWLGYALLIGTAYATAVWGLWLIGRALVGALGRERYEALTRRSRRVAIRASLWGIVALSAYALAIFLWDWIEWRSALGAGLILAGDPNPGPIPAFDPWQIPLGVAAFAAVGAVPLLGLRALRKRRRLVTGGDPGDQGDRASRATGRRASSAPERPIIKRKASS